MRGKCASGFCSDGVQHRNQLQASCSKQQATLAHNHGRQQSKPACTTVSRLRESKSTMRERLGCMLKSVSTHSYLQGRHEGVRQGGGRASDLKL